MNITPGYFQKSKNCANVIYITDQENRSNPNIIMETCGFNAHHNYSLFESIELLLVTLDFNK
jgi:hypothetical protein